MNLATYVPLFSVQDKVEEFLCSVLKENIKLRSGRYADYIYPLTDKYAMNINVFNEYSLDETHYSEFIDMLLEGMNELELSILSKSAGGSYIFVHSESSYPFNGLGGEGYRYLMMQDTSRSNVYYYTLESFLNVMNPTAKAGGL